ncbi:MAG TPA: AI-2E family transporter [Gammaproteobacteria bacterium]|nr:AI-2E family transporter [Gammaproteobacteria bacterium]
MSTQPGSRLFGSVERRLFRATAVLFAIVALVLLIALVVWALAGILSYFYKLVLPLSVAGILALVLYPVVDFLEARLRLNRAAATGLILMLFMAMIAGAAILLVPTLVRQISHFTEIAPGILSSWQEYLSARFPGTFRTVMANLDEGTLKEIVPDVERPGMALKSYAGVLVGLGFVPLFLFFALLSGGCLRDQVKGFLAVFSPATQKNTLYFIDVFTGQVTGFFQGQLVIAVIMGAMFAAGFTVIGLKGGILVGLVLGLLNIVPFLGTLIGLLVVLPMAYFQPEGSLNLVGLSLLVFAIVQLVESWLLTPRIMANRSGLHPALVVISVFFWGTALGGIIGMILAVPLTAFLVAVWAQAKASLARGMRADEDVSRIAIPGGSPDEAPMARQPTDPAPVLE